MKTYQLFLAFALVGVITTVVSFQTIHLVQENCDQTHFCHDSDHHEKNEAEECTSFEATDEECPICELKLPLLTPVSEPAESATFIENFDTSCFSYTAPRPDARPELTYLRGPPQNS